jgi:hypothetical protein
MTNSESLNKLHQFIREKDKEYQSLLELLQADPPSGSELFSLKRKIIVLSHEKSFLIQQAKDLQV